MKRVGIYSGTFDPVHIGHVGFAIQALDTAGLDEVVFIPEKIPREKPHVTDISHRFALLQRAVDDFPGLSVRLLSAEQFCVGGTLPELQAMFGDDTELWLLIGSDVVRTFKRRWNNLEKLFEDVGLVIGLRGGDAARDVNRMLKALKTQAKPRSVIVEVPRAAANSSSIRRGEVTRDVLPEVLEYIKEHQLYDSSSSS